MLGHNSTADWKKSDAAHHVHSFTDPDAMAAGGTRIIVKAEGCYVWDSNGNKFLDGMAGVVGRPPPPVIPGYGV